MAETDKKPRRWLYPLLFVSLALNLLVAGMIVGWLASPGGPKRSEFGSARGLVGEPFLRALPDDQRRAMLRDISRDAPKLRESRESLKARFDGFLTALRADPYEPETVAALLRDQREAALTRQDIGERLLLDRLEAMTPEERNAYADALEQSFRRLRRSSD
jgi:uncharacterized membrane protein